MRHRRILIRKGLAVLCVVVFIGGLLTVQIAAAGVLQQATSTPTPIPPGYHIVRSIKYLTRAQGQAYDYELVQIISGGCIASTPGCDSHIVGVAVKMLSFSGAYPGFGFWDCTDGLGCTLSRRILQKDSAVFLTAGTQYCGNVAGGYTGCETLYPGYTYLGVPAIDFVSAGIMANYVIQFHSKMAPNDSLAGQMMVQVDVIYLNGNPGSTPEPTGSVTPTQTVTPTQGPCFVEIGSAMTPGTPEPIIVAGDNTDGEARMRFTCLEAVDECCFYASRGGSDYFEGCIWPVNDIYAYGWQSGDTWRVTGGRGSAAWEDMTGEICQEIGGGGIGQVDISHYLDFHDTDWGCWGVEIYPSTSYEGWSAELCLTFRTLDHLRLGDYDMLPHLNVALAALSVILLIMIWRR